MSRADVSSNPPLFDGHSGAVRWAAFLLVLLGSLVAVRLFHLSGPLDDPHSWRQADTAYYAKAFYQYGIDVAYPSVCWLGDHRTLALEFPVHEMLVALGYHLLGPHLWVARVVSFAFFLASGWYLFALVREVYSARLALLTVVVYAALPLGQFYSRAVHVDFAAVAAGHAMLYYLVRAYREGRAWMWVAATLAGVGAFLVKAPYAFYLFLPFSVVVLWTPRWLRLAAAVPVAVVPVVAFLVWRGHAEAVNATAPDWFFVPTYMKFVRMDNFYFGSISQRLDLANWRTLWIRLVGDVAGSPLGVGLVLAGLIARTSQFERAFCIAWLVGVGVYLVTFFNLNVIHNYYQIPLLAIAALLMARGLDALLFRRERGAAWAAASVAMLVGVVVTSTIYAERHYYQVDRVRDEAGAFIAANVEEGALIITAMEDTDPRDPRLLYRSGRNGWAVQLSRLDDRIVTRLEEEGASYLAVVDSAPQPPAWTDSRKAALHREAAIAERALHIWLFRLHPPVAAAGPPR